MLIYKSEKAKKKKEKKKKENIYSIHRVLLQTLFIPTHTVNYSHNTHRYRLIFGVYLFTHTEISHKRNKR